MDCSVASNVELCSKFGVQMLPTLIYFPQGEDTYRLYPSRAERSFEKLTEFSIGEGWREEKEKKLYVPTFSVYNDVYKKASNQVKDLFKT